MNIDVPAAFWNALLTVLQNFTSWITDQADAGAMGIMMDVIGLIRGLGFVTTTDIGLVNTLSDLIGWAQVAPLVDAVLRTGLLLGAAAHAGHHWFGWRPINDSLPRWFVTILLTRLSWQLMAWSLRVMSAFTTGLAVSIPDFPPITGVNPFLLIALMLVWVFLLFQLVLISAERISWLAVLQPIAPLAFLTWVTPQSSWIASKFIQLWVGWLIGQFFVILAVAAMVQMIARGGLEGYFLSCACLLVARKAISMLAPTALGGGLVKVGPVKV